MILFYREEGEEFERAQTGARDRCAQSEFFPPLISKLRIANERASRKNLLTIFNLFFRWVLTSSARGSLPTLRTVSLTTRFFPPRTIFPIFVTSNLALRWKKGSPSTAWTSWPLLQPPQNGSSSANASSQALQCSSGSAPSSASSPTVSRCCDCPAVFLRFVCIMYVQINIRV